ncbi:glycosyltransferase [Rhodoferax sp.]|uniref:glycosyltransferase n=1 Tax=Rhodoferax sp. TaxID=50421 RepID=UPI0027720716|nr:glycosyltransferase [Rhodoferax sp.]
MARILIVGKGGYGDMFPLFSIAQALQTSGHAVTVAAEQHHEPATSSIGVGLIPIDLASASDGLQQQSHFDPGANWLSAVFRTLSPASIEDEYEILTSEVQKSDLIIGNQLAYSGAIAARKWGKPWVFCAPSPLAIPSYFDPPLFPYLHRLQTFAGQCGVSQDYFIDLARHASKLLMLSNIRLQKRLHVYGHSHPRFEGMYSGLLNIMPVSPAILAAQPDWPTNTVVSGFNWFEPTFMRNPQELDRISAFCESGDKPIVIAPGGSKRTQPGAFFDECLAACRLLGVRAIVVAAKRFHDRIAASPDVLVSGYVPYSFIFDKAAAVIHSAGIGTIGWSLRYALPSLLIPTDWDQFDNARRVQKLGLAAVIPKRALAAPRIATALEDLLQDSELKAALGRVSTVVAAEDGARVALAEIETVLNRRG